MGNAEELQPGTVFAGKYRIERPLGEGGMSAVYVATNQVLQNRVALKVLTDELAAVPEAVERFLREGVAASRVKHRAIVQLFDAGQDNDRPWMAMELLDGESLSERYKRVGPMPPAEVVRIAREVVGGLAAAHAHGVIHRDLKPHNIFLDESSDPPQPKILDFGIAKLGDTHLAKLTQTGIMMGTPHYMSPEQAQGKSNIGLAADVWALGVIMLEGVSAQMPYEAESVAAYIGKLVTAAPRSVRELAPTTPPALVELIERCLRTDPAERPTSAEVLMAELDRVAAHIARNPAIPPTLNTAATMAEEADPLTSPEPIASLTRPSVSPGATNAGYSEVVAAPSPPDEGELTGADGVAPAAAELEPKGRSRLAPIITLIAVAVMLPVTCTIVGAVSLSRSACSDDTPTTATTSEPTADPMAAWRPETSTSADQTAPQKQPTKNAGSWGSDQQPAKNQTPQPPAQSLSLLVASHPAGAAVYLHGIPLGKRTPAVLKLHGPAKVEVRLDGYKSASKRYDPSKGVQSFVFQLEKAGD